MGRAKDKGNRREREIVNRLRGLGLDARRVPLSGSAEGFEGDLIVRWRGGGSRRGEVKARANGEGWRVIESWLGGNDLLFLVKDRAEPLVVVPWRVFAELMEGANGPDRKTDDEGGD